MTTSKIVCYLKKKKKMKAKCRLHFFNTLEGKAEIQISWDRCKMKSRKKKMLMDWLHSKNCKQKIQVNYELLHSADWRFCYCVGCLLVLFLKTESNWIHLRFCCCDFLILVNSGLSICEYINPDQNLYVRPFRQWSKYVFTVK